MSARTYRILIAVALAISLSSAGALIYGFHFADRQSRTSQTKALSHLAEVPVETLSGAKVMVGTLLRNRPNVLAFVSPDCSHCQTELSVLDRLVASVPNGTGIVVVADALHHSEKELAEFAAEHRNLAVYFDRHRARLQLGFRFVPVIVCVGRDGSVRQIITGERTQEALAAAMRANAS